MGGVSLEATPSSVLLSLLYFGLRPLFFLTGRADDVGADDVGGAGKLDVTSRVERSDDDEVGVTDCSGGMRRSSGGVEEK